MLPVSSHRDLHRFQRPPCHSVLFARGGGGWRPRILCGNLAHPPSKVHEWLLGLLPERVMAQLSVGHSVCPIGPVSPRRTTESRPLFQQDIVLEFYKINQRCHEYSAEAAGVFSY